MGADLPARGGQNHFPAFLYRHISPSRVAPLDKSIRLKMVLDEALFQDIFGLREERKEQYLSFTANDPLDYETRADHERVGNAFAIAMQRMNIKAQAGLLEIRPAELCDALNPVGEDEVPLVSFQNKRHPHYGMVYGDYNNRYLVFQEIVHLALLHAPRENFLPSA